MPNTTNASTEWVMVPRKIAGEMLYEMWRGLFGNCDHATIQEAYRRAIKAAPPAPEAGETQSPPVIGWMRLHPNGDPSGEYLSDAVIEDVRRRSGQWVPLIRQPNDPTPAAPPAGTNTAEGA